MTIEHKNITNVNLHEAKGASTAATDSVLHASSGVNAWKFQEHAVNLDIVDLVTDTSYFIPTPYACTITSITTCIDNAFTTADCSVLAEIDGVAVTNGAIIITQSGSAAGDVDTVTPTALNTTAAGGSIEIVVSGTNATSTRCHVVLILRRIA